MTADLLCQGDECTAQLPDDGEAVGWTVWTAEAERVVVLCPECTTWWRAEADSQPRRGVSMIPDLLAQVYGEVQR